MRQLSLRACMIMALVLIIIVAFFSIEGPSLVLSYRTNQTWQSDIKASMWFTDSSQWRDPAWQQKITKRLAALDISAVIRDPQGHILYHAGTWNQEEGASQEIIVMDGHQPVGTVFLYECTPTAWLTQHYLLIGLGVLLLTLTGVVCFSFLTILKPLSALAQAAHKVRQNEYDFQLPATPMREVETVFTAFDMMSRGLRESLQRQTELEQERRLFISAIAHDLRTPLFSLRGYLEGLATGLANTPEKAAKYIGVCQAKAALLERLIGDLFVYTQFEYLEQIPQRETLEIGALITHVLESLEPQVQSKRITLVSEPPAEPCFTQGDEHLLTRVFENLLDNAIRYTPEQGTIRVQWHPEQERIIFSITDTGPGISSTDLPHLFMPLYRGDPSRSSHTGGAGLGLTIAQRILKAHDGDLVARNAVEKGSVFTGSLALSTRAASMVLEHV